MTGGDLKDAKNNIVLIGFMGSGKSVVGRIIAQQLDYDFVETDGLIEKSCGLSIEEIFTIKGEAFFRQEEQKLLEALKCPVETVISTGGGMACSDDAIKKLQQLGSVVYLRCAIPTLTDRLYGDEKRPLLRSISSRNKLKRRIAEMMRIRRPFYQRAHFTVNANHSPKDTAQNVVTALRRAGLLLP